MSDDTDEIMAESVNENTVPAPDAGTFYALGGEALAPTEDDVETACNILSAIESSESFQHMPNGGDMFSIAADSLGADPDGAACKLAVAAYFHGDTPLRYGFAAAESALRSGWRP